MNKYTDNKNYDEEMDYFVKELKMFLEREDAMDKSLFPKDPIDEQLKNMTPDDFFKLFNNDFSYQDDIVNTVDKQIKEIEEMINNNDNNFNQKELEKNAKNTEKVMNGFKMMIEMEDAMDPSLFPKDPIDEQLKNMTPDDFFKLFNNDFSYQDDIVNTVDKQIKDIEENNIKVEMEEPSIFCNH
jgi:beta-lactamase class D